MLLFGVHKDAATLQKMLDPASFAGIVISDDAAVYAQLHRRRKSAGPICCARRSSSRCRIRTTRNTATFTDRLLEIYREACRVQRDERLSDAGRARKVRALDDEIFDLCVAKWLPDQPPSKGLEKDYRLLVNEVTTFLNCFSGLDEISKGTVTLEGVNIHSLKDAARQPPSEAQRFVFQSVQPPPESSPPSTSRCCS